MRRPSPFDVALKVGWSSVFGVGLQQPTFNGSQQENTDDQQTNAKKTDDQCKICYINWRGSIRWLSAIPPYVCPSSGHFTESLHQHSFYRAHFSSLLPRYHL